MERYIGSKHLIADTSVALDVSGREHLVVVVKGTWSIPKPGGRPRPLEPQSMVVADQFYGEPGESALRYGFDFARFKPACDVIFDACAHSPTGQPVHEIVAGWQVGPIGKAIRVLGPRRWQRTLGLNSLTQPEPFISAPLHYGLAFGGTRHYADAEDGAEPLAEAYAPNPVGIGFAGRRTVDQVHDQPAPRLEPPSKPVRIPGGKYEPWAFSPVPSNCPARLQYAGTYDAAWEAEVSPFLPEDFDERFYQCAPPDQQMPYPRGGESVVLMHLRPERPNVVFTLPPLDRVAIRVLRTDYSTETLTAVVDTLFFETEAQRFTAVWRASTPIRRRVQEFDTLAIGPVDPAWWRARSLGLEQEGGCAGCGDGPPDAVFAEAEA
jgi:hypothetical protein